MEYWIISKGIEHRLDAGDLEAYANNEWLFKTAIVLGDRIEYIFERKIPEEA